MNRFFWSPAEDESRSAWSVIFLKAGLALSVIVQALGWMGDADLVFSSRGLLPDSLVVHYGSWFQIGDSLGTLIGPALILLALLTIWPRLQNVSFFLIAILELVLLRRNSVFANAGDAALAYFTLMAVFLPAVDYRKPRALVNVKNLLPLWTLFSIVYLINLGFKVSSRWGSGEGLRDTLNHVEMTRGWDFSTWEPLLNALNFAAFPLVVVAIALPWISNSQKNLKNSFVLLVVSYHLAANLFLKLSWLSMPFLVFALAFWVVPVEKLKDFAPPEKPLLKRAAWVLVILGFFGMHELGEHPAFDKNSFFPWGHNWYMFAPPPPGTSQWLVEVKQTDGEFKVFKMSDYPARPHFFLFQHEYKFYNNLRRADQAHLVRHFSEWLCRETPEPKPQSLRLISKMQVFALDQEYTTEHPEVPCL